MQIHTIQRIKNINHSKLYSNYYWCQSTNVREIPVITSKPSDMSFSSAPGSFGESRSSAPEESFFPQHIPFPYQKPNPNHLQPHFINSSAIGLHIQQCLVSLG